MRVDVGLVEVVDGRVHEAGGVGGLHDGQSLRRVAGEGVLDAPVVLRLIIWLSQIDSV